MDGIYHHMNVQMVLVPVSSNHGLVVGKSEGVQRRAGGFQHVLPGWVLADGPGQRKMDDWLLVLSASRVTS
jgi:hypothetical protein